MGSVTLELWQLIGAGLLTGVSGWLAKRHLGSGSTGGGQGTQPAPAGPVPPASKDAAGKLPGWIGFALKLSHVLKTGKAANPQLQPIVDALEHMVHDEVKVLTGIDLPGPMGISSPPVVPSAQGGGS